MRRSRAARDVLISNNYRALLTELVLLTTVSVLIFGFLLNSGSHAARGAEQGVYVLAMITVSSATMVFILPGGLPPHRVSVREL
jgi:hypothetical protein